MARRCPLFRGFIVIWSGLKSRTVGFVWSCMCFTFAELNGRTLTRHLWFSFRVTQKTFDFFTMLSPSTKIILRLMTTTDDRLLHLRMLFPEQRFEFFYTHGSKITSNKNSQQLLQTYQLQFLV